MVSPKLVFQAALRGPSGLIALARGLKDAADLEDGLQEVDTFRRSTLVGKFRVKGMTELGANEMASWVFDHQSPLGPRLGAMTPGDAFIWTNLITKSKNYSQRPLSDARYILYLAAGTDEPVDRTFA
jgi:hypothetical protein